MAEAKSVLQYRRKRERKTNYRRRLALLKSGLPRLTVRVSLRKVYIQIIEYYPSGDKILVSCESSKLKDYGWKLSNANLPSAYLTGLLCGKLVKGKVGKVIFDSGRGEVSKGNISYAALKGFADSGAEIPFSDDKLPSVDRISGVHIKNYALSLKAEGDKYKSYFGNYLKSGINPEEIDNLFNQVKEKIMNM